MPPYAAWTDFIVGRGDYTPPPMHRFACIVSCLKNFPWVLGENSVV